MILTLICVGFLLLVLAVWLYQRHNHRWMGLLGKYLSALTMRVDRQQDSLKRLRQEVNELDRDVNKVEERIDTQIIPKPYDDDSA